MTNVSRVAHMASLRWNATRHQWILQLVGLFFLITCFIRATASYSRTGPDGIHVRAHGFQSRAGRAGPMGESSDRHSSYWYKDKSNLIATPLAQFARAPISTDGAALALEGVASQAGSSSHSAEGVSGLQVMSSGADSGRPHTTDSHDINSSSGLSEALNLVAEFRSSENTSELDDSTSLRGVNTEQGTNFHGADYSAETLLPRKPLVDSDSGLTWNPYATGIMEGIVTPPTRQSLTSGFRGAQASGTNMAQPSPRRQESDLLSKGLLDMLISSAAYPADVLRSGISQQKKEVDGTARDSHGGRFKEPTDGVYFAPPRVLQADSVEGQMDRSTQKEPAQTSLRLISLQAKVAEHTSDFEEAAKRACSPRAYAKYVDIVQNQMDGAVGNLEDLIAGVTSGWLNNAFGYEDLKDLIQDKITVLDYVKRNPVFLTLIGVALVLAIVWLFGCTPKICCRCCRRLCFCIPERRHKFGFLGRLIVTLLGAVALLTIVVFAILVSASQYSGVGGVRALQCHVYTTVEEIVNGSNTTTVDPSEQFVGVKPLFRELKEVSAKLDTSGPQSIVTDLRRQITMDLNFNKGIAASKGYLKAITQALADPSNQVEQFHHICQACEAAKDNNHPVGRALTALNTAISSPNLDMSAEIEKVFDQFTFPSIALDDVVPVEEVEKGLEKITDTLANVEPSVTSGLTYSDAAFGVTYVFVFLMACVGVIWIVFFFFRGAKTGSALACVQWNVLCFSMVLILLVAGVIGFVTNTALRGCEYVNKEVIVDDKWGELVRKVDSDDQFLGPLLEGCFGSAGTGNLVDILGYRAEYDAMIHKVDSALDDFVKNVPTTPPMAVQDHINTVRTVARGYGWAATTNIKDPTFKQPTADPTSRLNTFAEFLSSGVQLEDRTYDVAAANGSVAGTLYGLRTLEKLVQPWKFSAIRGKDPDDKFMISDTYPKENDPDFVAWLQKYEEDVKAKLEAQRDIEAAQKSKIAGIQMKNAVWWSVEKHKVVYKTYKCFVYDPVTDKITVGSCTGQTFFAYTPYDWSQSYIVGTFEKLVEALSSLAEAVLNAPTNASTNASSIILGLLQKVKSVVKGLNCKFMRRGFVTGTNIACSSAFLPMYKAAVYGIVTCGGLLVWTVLLLIIWRKLKDNATLKKKV